MDPHSPFRHSVHGQTNLWGLPFQCPPQHCTRSWRAQPPPHLPQPAETQWYAVMGCSSATQLGISETEGLEGLEMNSFWIAASACALCLPSIVVHVFKVLATSEKYVKIPENYFQKVQCFSKDSSRFQVVSSGRNLRRRPLKWRKSYPASRVQKVLRQYLWAAERYGTASEGR